MSQTFFNIFIQVASRHNMYDVMSVSRRPCSNFQHGRRRRSSGIRVYKFSLSCSGFASISGTAKEKWGGHVHPSPRCGNAPNTYRACRTRRTSRDARVAQCCKTS